MLSWGKSSADFYTFLQEICTGSHKTTPIFSLAMISKETIGKNRYLCLKKIRKSFSLNEDNKFSPKKLGEACLCDRNFVNKATKSVICKLLVACLQSNFLFDGRLSTSQSFEIDLNSFHAFRVDFDKETRHL